MISVIICSRTKDIPQSLKDNIAETIGIEYELIVIDNSKNRYSIFTAYNEGVQLSKYPYLCFMHNDILFQTGNWGQQVIEHFKDEKVGCIGVIGSHFIPNTPTGWASSDIISGQIQNNEGLIQKDLSRMTTSIIDVVAVDGVWFCIPKEVIRFVKFDNIIFDGFHVYDIDICLQIRQFDYKVCVVSNILIKHLSDGDWNLQWLDSTEKLYQKWKCLLPQFAGTVLTEEEIKIRTSLVKNIFLWQKEYCICKDKLSRIQNSLAYKLGKIQLKPFSIIKRKIK